MEKCRHSYHRSAAPPVVAVQPRSARKSRRPALRRGRHHAPETVPGPQTIRAGPSPPPRTPEGQPPDHRTPALQAHSPTRHSPTAPPDLEQDDAPASARTSEVLRGPPAAAAPPSSMDGAQTAERAGGGPVNADLVDTSAAAGRRVGRDSGGKRRPPRIRRREFSSAPGCWRRPSRHGTRPIHVAED